MVYDDEKKIDDVKNEWDSQVNESKECAAFISKKEARNYNSFF